MKAAVMSNIRKRIVFWLTFAAFAIVVAKAGYYHVCGKGYCRPVLVTEKKILDLGAVPPDSLTEYEFFVTNGGVRPLRIEKVKSGCAGCIVIISFPTEPIRRGESVPIRIALNSESLKGRTRKSLVIISNDPIRSVYPMLIGAVVEQQELPENK